jgi:hypothetical protein
MLDPNESNRRSDEAAVKDQFEKLGYVVEKLDRKTSKRKRPDFLISNSSGPQMLCEVKTKDSAFYPRDKKKYGVEHVHISTRDPKFVGRFQNIPIDLSKIDEPLAKAVRKRAALIADHPEYTHLPLLVALFLDQFLREYLFAYPPSFDERDERFREVSGILKIESHVAALPESFEALSDEEKGEFLRDALTAGSRRTDFVLKKNKAAIRAVPEDFERRCLPDA